MKLLKGNPVLSVAMIGILWIITVRFLLPWDTIPFRFEEFLFFKSGFWTIAWPLFAAGFFVNLFKMATTLNPPEIRATAPSVPVKGFFISLSAGILEEVAFRWVLLYAFMGLFWCLNLLLPDIKTFSDTYLSGFTAFLVGGSAEAILSHPGAWTLPLAVLLSNWKFQNGHLYQGVSGWIFAWFGGLVFFMITLQYGLFAAMLTHFLFDWMVFIMLFADLIWEDSTGPAKDRMYHWYRYQ